MVVNYKNYALFNYEQAQEETLDPFVLGHVVINNDNEIGVIIQRHSGNEYRTDMFGNCCISEIREATKQEIEQFRPQLLN
jgi:hypothetical protein